MAGPSVNTAATTNQVPPPTGQANAPEPKGPLGSLTMNSVPGTAGQAGPLQGSVNSKLVWAPRPVGQASSGTGSGRRS